VPLYWLSYNSGRLSASHKSKERQLKIDDTQLLTPYLQLLVYWSQNINVNINCVMFILKYCVLSRTLNSFGRVTVGLK